MNTSGVQVESIQLLARCEQLQAAGQLVAAEESLNEALKLDRDNLQILQAAARFYSTAVQSPEKAREFASKCRDEAAVVITEMDELLGNKKIEQHAGRHIGGIIGPY